MEAGRDEYIQSAFTCSVIGGVITYQDKMHAVGMYPFIKFLDQRYPDDKELWIRIIRGIINSESGTPMEGIISALEEPEHQWWQGFFEKYMTRQLVDVPADEFLKLFQGIDYQVDFFYEKDTSRFNKAEYSDLSAKLFKISFLFPSFEKEATLKTLQENDYSAIPVAVVNSASGPPSGRTINIGMESSLRTTPAEPLNFYQVDVTIDARANYTDENGITSEDDYTFAMYPREGEVVDHTFTATWSDPEYITRYYFTQTVSSQNSSSASTYTVTGENLSFRGYETDIYDAPLYLFWASNSDACDYITTLYYESQDHKGEIIATTDGTPVCDDNTMFGIKLYYVEE